MLSTSGLCICVHCCIVAKVLHVIFAQLIIITVIVRRTFSQWQEYHQHTLVRQAANTQAIAQYRNKSLSTLFAAWTNFTRASKTRTANRTRAARFWIHKKVAHAFSSWREWCAQHQRAQSLHALAVRHWGLRTTWQALISWKEYTVSKRSSLDRQARNIHRAHVTHAGKRTLLFAHFSLNFH